MTESKSRIRRNKIRGKEEVRRTRTLKGRAEGRKEDEGTRKGKGEVHRIMKKGVTG
ncbi:hypothetical protein B7P43_G07334 [Cryptotermes secundus]|uniref:Uncharacterized protein n=1 Tax=Cryptotermes secundus TaxID=105785 RepID=A0A2J7PMT8_9NEOP|nr:hypothetical protein B7P43_G07334 [Cryptotermes secundus]